MSDSTRAAIGIGVSLSGCAIVGLFLVVLICRMKHKSVWGVVQSAISRRREHWWQEADWPITKESPNIAVLERVYTRSMSQSDFDWRGMEEPDRSIMQARSAASLVAPDTVRNCALTQRISPPQSRGWDAAESACSSTVESISIGYTEASVQASEVRSERAHSTRQTLFSNRGFQNNNMGNGNFYNLSIFIREGVLLARRRDS